MNGQRERKALCLVLGIETSCDETAAAVVDSGRWVHSNVISSQIDLHRRFGGVVPEIASRRHVELILPVVQAALEDAEVDLASIDGIAVTYGPGLVGSLLVGLSAAKALALAHGLPWVGVNHIEGHIYANLLDHPHIEPPLVCLTVSGGHTELLFMERFGMYQVLGRTRDDAAGEAIDKVGRVLGLPYPAGPELDALAAQGDVAAFDLPRGLGDHGYDFSFSGVKTAAINTLHHHRQTGKEVDRADFAASLLEAVVDVLVQKSMAAVDELRVKTLLMSGGVAANRRLRARMQAECDARDVRLYYPSPALCTDNAAMIAGAGYFRLAAGEQSPWSLNAEPGLRLT